MWKTIHQHSQQGNPIGLGVLDTEREHHDVDGLVIGCATLGAVNIGVERPAFPHGLAVIS
jgi:hypothetical protein